MIMTIKEEEGEEEEGEEQIGEEEEGEEEEGGEEEGKEEGEEEGGQESGRKYWPLGQSLVRLLACSHRSLICLLHTAHFAQVLHCAHSFFCSLTHSRACGKVNH